VMDYLQGTAFRPSQSASIESVQPSDSAKPSFGLRVFVADAVSALSAEHLIEHPVPS